MATARRKTQHPFSVVAQDKAMLRAASNVVPLEFPTDTTESETDVSADIFALLEGFALQQIRRYFHHRYWETETIEAAFAERAEPGVQLENVAAHSWHVADATLLLMESFDWLDRERCLSLAILHDKLEMFTGDENPVGRDGTGSKTHAFDEQAKLTKSERELRALDQYLSRLSKPAAERQHRLFLEMIAGSSEETRFVKAIDKLQALAFVHIKKRGNLLDSHIRFTLRYSYKTCEYFPQLRQHYDFLRLLFLEEIANKRGCSAAQLERDLFSQLELEFPLWGKAGE